MFTYSLFPPDDPPQQFLCLCKECDNEWEVCIEDCYDINDYGHGICIKPKWCPACESEDIEVDTE